MIEAVNVIEPVDVAALVSGNDLVEVIGSRPSRAAPITALPLGDSAPMKSPQ